MKYEEKKYRLDISWQTTKNIFVAKNRNTLDSDLIHYKIRTTATAAEAWNIPPKNKGTPQPRLQHTHKL